MVNRRNRFVMWSTASAHRCSSRATGPGSPTGGTRALRRPRPGSGSPDRGQRCSRRTSLCSPRNRGPARPADIASPPPASPDAPPPSSGPPLRPPCSSPFRLAGPGGTARRSGRARRHHAGRAPSRPRVRRRSRSTCRPPRPPPPPQPAPRPCRRRWARSARGTVSARRVRTPSTAPGWSTGPTAAPARRCRAPAGRCRGSAPRSPSRRCSPATWCSSTGGPSHVAIYVGNGKVVHASNPAHPVKIADLNSMPFNSARRV